MNLNKNEYIHDEGTNEDFTQIFGLSVWIKVSSYE